MLHDTKGNRKYLTADERQAFIAAAHQQPPHIATFCLTIAFTGARISEVLSLRAGSIDKRAGVIVVESLKKRRRGVYRQVLVPESLLTRLEVVHDLKRADSDTRLWTCGRTTAWGWVKEVLAEAQVLPACAMPKALRHAFGVVGVSEAKVPLNMMQKWLGHARIETTAIYANAVGPEERAIAELKWR